MGHLSQTRVLVSLTKLQVNKKEPTLYMENLSIATNFCGPSLQRPENCGENCEKNRKTFRLDSLVWDFDNGMNAKCFDEGVRTQHFPTAF